jgi:hypothetical protein
VLVSYWKAGVSAAIIGTSVLLGCGGGDTTPSPQKAQQEGRADPSAAHGNAAGPLRGEQHSRQSRRPASHGLLPSGFYRQVLGGSKQAGVVVAPLARGRIRSFGTTDPPHAWSTIKPVIAVAVLRARRAGQLSGGRLPTSSERSLIARAIENSDNAAAAELFTELGPLPRATAALQRVLVDAGDTKTQVNGRVTRPEFSTYGQTLWQLSEEARFYRQLANGCLVSRPDSRLILEDMGAVTSVGGASWGLPVVGFPQLRFKAGWGPEQGASAYTALQYGIVGDAESSGYVIGIVAQTHGDASSAYATVTAVARRVERSLHGRRAPSTTPSC